MSTTEPDHEFSDERIPLGYLIHFGVTAPGFTENLDRWIAFTTSTVRLDYRETRNESNTTNAYSSSDQSSWTLDSELSVQSAIKETCEIRKWELWVSNIRTNHVHTVVSALCKPEPILNALKANASRKMRESGCWLSERGPWVRRGSKRYLWTEEDLRNAIAYVLYEQGDSLP